MSEESRTCSQCVNYLTPDVTRVRLGTTYGPEVAFCAAKSIPLSTAHSTAAQRAATEEKFATYCDSFKKVDPSRGPLPSMATLPLSPSFVGTCEEVEVTVRPSSQDQFAPTSCKRCIYHVDPREVGSKYGWPHGLCLAKGTLIPTKIARSQAKSCTLGIETGTVLPAFKIPELSDFEPLAVYAIQITGRETARVSATGNPDPLLHATEDTVTAEDRAMGILAWRVVRHPEQPEKFAPVKLPIFDPEFFDEQARELIPRPGDDAEPELYQDYSGIIYKLAVNLFGKGLRGRAINLQGPAGVGKTEAFRYLAYQTQLPFNRVSITRSTDIADVMGFMHVSDSRGEDGSVASVTDFVPGPIPQWWGRPGVLLVDEPNAAQPEVWQAMRALTDGSKELVLVWDKGQRIRRHEHCLFGYATNPAWDPRYIGVEELSIADMNRVGICWIDYPPEEVEKSIIVSKCHNAGMTVTQKLVDTLVALGADIRRMSDPANGGELSVSWSPRIGVATALYTQYMSLSEAVNMSIGDWLDPDQRNLVATTVRGYES